MAILAECPVCHNKQTVRNKVCKCGTNLDAEKRRKKVFYHIVYRVEGKQIWKALSTFENVKGNSIEDAKTVEGKFRTAKKENRLDVFDIQPEATMTFRELSAWYLKQPKRRNKSLWRTKGALDRINASEIGGKKVKDIKKTDLETYAVERAAGPATVDQEIGAAKAVINLAFENDMVGSKTFKTFKSVKKMLKMGSNARKEIISVEQFEALTQGCPRHVSQMVTIGYHTGMRFGEINKLTWLKVNLKERFIALDAEDTKEAEPKRVPLSNTLLTLLKSIPRNIHNPHVFLYKGKPVNDIRTGLKKGCKIAEIEYGRYKDFTFQTLRHTFKTDCRGAGISDHVSEAIMGHSDGNDMSKRYDTISDQDRLDAVNKLEAFRDSVRQNVSFEENGKIREIGNSLI